MHVKKCSRKRAQQACFTLYKQKSFVTLEGLWTAQTQLNLHIQMQTYIRYFSYDVLSPRWTPCIPKSTGSIQRKYQCSSPIFWCSRADVLTHCMPKELQSLAYAVHRNNFTPRLL